MMFSSSFSCVEMVFLDNFTEICPQGSIKQYASISSDNVPHGLDEFILLQSPRQN